MPSYVSVGPGLPDIAVEIAFASLPTDATQTWTDVTAYTRAIDIKRGRNNDLSRVEAGTLDLLLDNRDARFNPENTSGAYYPNVVPKRQVRVSARSGATERQLFTGTCGGFPQEWPEYGKDALVKLSAVDLMGTLARARFASPLSRTITNFPEVIAFDDLTINVGAAPTYWPVSFPHTVTVEQEDMTVTADTGSVVTVTRGANGTEAVDHRGTSTLPMTTLGLQTSGLSSSVIVSLIDRALWRTISAPFGFYSDVQEGRTTIQTGVISADANPLELIQSCVESEAGLLFIATEGRPVFHDRLYRATTLGPSAAEATFGENTLLGEILYQDVATTQDDNLIYPTVAITNADGRKVVVTDATSEAANWPQTLSRSSLAASGDEDLAYFLLSKYKDVKLRTPDLLLDGHNVPGTLLVDLDLDRHYVVKRRPAVGTTITKDVFSEGVSHSISPGHWQTRLNLSEASRDTDYWRLGTALLGTTTRLAF